MASWHPPPAQAGPANAAGATTATATAASTDQVRMRAFLRMATTPSVSCTDPVVSPYAPGRTMVPGCGGSADAAGDVQHAVERERRLEPEREVAPLPEQHVAGEPHRVLDHVPVLVEEQEGVRLARQPEPGFAVHLDRLKRGPQPEHLLLQQPLVHPGPELRQQE